MTRMARGPPACRCAPPQHFRAVNEYLVQFYCVHARFCMCYVSYTCDIACLWNWRPARPKCARRLRAPRCMAQDAPGASCRAKSPWSARARHPGSSTSPLRPERPPCAARRTPGSPQSPACRRGGGPCLSRAPSSAGWDLALPGPGWRRRKRSGVTPRRSYAADTPRLSPLARTRRHPSPGAPLAGPPPHIWAPDSLFRSP